MIPSDQLAQALAKLRTANRIDGTKNSYRKDNPSEYDKVMQYLDGAARPTVTSDMGLGLVGVEDARRALTTTPEPEPEPEPPISGTILFNADNEVAAPLQQWSSIANGDLTTVTAQNGVTPVQGSRMLRCYVSTSNRASWEPSLLQASVIQKNPTPGVTNNTDVYTGWSFYIVPGFQYAGNAHATLMEYHGGTGMQQAPIHFGIFGNGGSAGHFFLDLHRQASAYSPVFQNSIGPMITGKWVDCILRNKWSSASDGVVQFWMKVRDGQPMSITTDRKINYNGATWNMAGVNIYLIHCVYRSIQSQDATVYFDNTKVGTTFDVVDPGRY